MTRIYVRIFNSCLSSKEVMLVKRVVRLEEMPEGLIIITDDMVLIGTKKEEGEQI